MKLALDVWHGAWESTGKAVIFAPQMLAGRRACSKSSAASVLLNPMGAPTEVAFIGR